MTGDSGFQFEPEVLAVFKTDVFFTPDGLEARIGPRLSRSTFAKVSEAILALGGRWSAQAKSYIFPSDPRPLIDGFLVDDLRYEPPVGLVERMIKEAGVLPSTLIMQPYAGRGILADAVITHGGRVFCLEQSPELSMELERKLGRGNVESGNFTSFACPPDIFDGVIMCPPLDNAMDCIVKAWNLTKELGKVVSVVPASLYLSERWKSFEKKHGLTETTMKSFPLPKDTFAASGVECETCLLVILKLYPAGL